MRWFEHAEKKDTDDWVRKCLYMEVEGARLREAKKTWLEVVRNDMKELVLKSGCSGPSCLDEEDCWRRFAWSTPGILLRMSRPINGVCVCLL